MTIFVDGYGSKIRKVNRYRPGWERDHPLSTYATGGMEGADRGEGGGDHPKCVQMCTGGGGRKIDHKICTY